MQKIKNKTMAILIIALLTISISASLILLPATKAHNPPWNSCQFVPRSIVNGPQTCSPVSKL